MIASKLVPGAALALALVAGLGLADAAAADLRFAALYPTGAGAWRAVVEGKLKKGESLALWVDGEERAAAWSELDGERRAATLEGVPADVRRFAVGSRGKKGAEPTASVAVAPRPEGFGDWTIYHVMMGYFRNGNPANDGELDGWRHPSYAGGDLQGVLEKVGYLADLGVTAVWLSPVFAAGTSHGYDVESYYRIGDAVGVPGDAEASLALFRRLVAALGERGIRVILDIPLNHASGAYDRQAGDPGKLEPRVTGARQEAEKVWEGWGSGYRYWNFDHEPTRRVLKAAALHWLTDEGVAGLRLDYVRGVDHRFWAELHHEAAAAKPGTFLVGECWIDAAGAATNAQEIATYYEPVAELGPQFDSLLDFPMQITATDVFARGGAATTLEVLLQGEESTYGEGAQPTYFLDNHDLPRFLAWTDDSRRLVSAVAFLAAQSAPLAIFYGTETGLTGGTARPGFTDAGRVPMPWDRLDADLVARVGGILQARKAHASLTHGGRLPLLAEKEALVMAKVGGDEVALVAINLSDTERTVVFAAGTLVDAAGTFTGLAGGTLPAASEAAGEWRWTLPPRSTSIAFQPRQTP